MIKIKTACGYKINVNLDITTTLASGYHNIDSMFLRLQKGDQLEFEVAADETQLSSGDWNKCLDLLQVEDQGEDSGLKAPKLQISAGDDLATEDNTYFAEQVKMLQRFSADNLVLKAWRYCRKLLELSLWRRVLLQLEEVLDEQQQILHKAAAAENPDLLNRVINYCRQSAHNLGPQQLDTVAVLCDLWQELNAGQVYKLIALLQKPCTFYLTKNIPLQSGLGAGSFDAAAVFKLIYAAMQAVSADDNGYKLPPYKDFYSCFDLENVAYQIGADVPFALLDDVAVARVEGIGENILPLAYKVPAAVPKADVDGQTDTLQTEIPENKLYFIVVMANYTMDTKLAYKLYDQKQKENKKLPRPDKHYGSDFSKVREYFFAKKFNLLSEAAQNTFTDLMLQVHPDYADFLVELKKCPQAEFVTMTGSGSACVLFFSDYGKREEAWNYYHNLQLQGKELLPGVKIMWVEKAESVPYASLGE